MGRGDLGCHARRGVLQGARRGELVQRSRALTAGNGSAMATARSAWRGAGASIGTGVASMILGGGASGSARAGKATAFQRRRIEINGGGDLDTFAGACARTG